MGELDNDSLDLLAAAGITGEDARTALAAHGRVVAAGGFEFGSDAGRVAAVLNNGG